jgi:hypothetical protein
MSQIVAANNNYILRGLDRNGNTLIHSSKAVMNYNLQDFSRVETWIVSLPTETDENIKLLIVKSIKGFTILNGITGSDQINVPPAYAGFFLRWANITLWSSFDMILNLLNDYNRFDQFTTNQINELSEIFGNIMACVNRIVRDSGDDIPDTISFDQMKRSFQAFDRFDIDNFADYDGYGYKQWFEFFSDNFEKINDICNNELDNIHENTKSWWNYAKSWFSPKEWGVFVKTGFTGTYSRRKQAWDKVKDDIAIEKGNIIHQRKNHIRVALTTLNNIMLMLIDERNHVIDVDTGEEINRRMCQESIREVESFKRQMITRIGIVRDKIGYLLNPQNQNILQNMQNGLAMR